MIDIGLTLNVIAPISATPTSKLPVVVVSELCPSRFIPVAKEMIP